MKIYYYIEMACVNCTSVMILYCSDLITGYGRGDSLLALVPISLKLVLKLVLKDAILSVLFIFNISQNKF